MRTLLVAGCSLALACGSSSGAGPGQNASNAGSSAGGTSAGGTSAGSTNPGGSTSSTGNTGTGGSTTSTQPGSSGSSTSGTRPADAGADGTVGPVDAGVSDGGFPAGWLYTSGPKIYVSNGSSAATQWMGRGVNMDDIFLCGYNNTLYLTNPDQTLETIVSGLMSAWKPTFVRMSLSMHSNATTASWVGSNAAYKTPMTNVIHAIGANANVHVLVTLRSDASMVETNANNEATYIPQAATDATYVALVDSFAHDGFVMFGLCNEPGTITAANLVPVMSHAVSVIRAEEDRLGVPHHIVSVQGSGWTSDISFYSTTPLTYDNVVYEVHGYPPPAASYTYSNIPVILGEYGSLTNSATFYADVEAKQIPNLAWDFEPYSNCAPDLLNVTHNASMLTPTAWGNTVQSYLLAH